MLDGRHLACAVWLGGRPPLPNELKRVAWEDGVNPHYRAAMLQEIEYLKTFTSGNFVEKEITQTMRDGTSRTRRVYQNTEDFDGGAPQVVDRTLGVIHAKVLELIDLGFTNQQLMERGYAPIGNDGKPINLHHLEGTEPGPMIELMASTHEAYTVRLHDMISDGSGVQGNSATKSAYRRWAKQYWMGRADDF